MRKFRFRFEQVLEYRRIRETLAQEAFAEALSAYLEQRERLLQMQEHRRALLERLREAHQGALDMEAISASEQYRSMLEMAILIQGRQVQELAGIAEEKRQILVEALKKREVMDKMKDQERAEYMNFIRRLEQKFLDEITATRFNDDRRSETLNNRP